MSLDFLKNKYTLILLLIVILLAGGVFYWQRNRIKIFFQKRKLAKIRAPSEDYSVVNKSGELFIVNKKDKLKIKVPDNWQVSLGTESSGTVSDYRSVLYSNNFNYQDLKGCLVEFYTSRLAEQYSEKFPGGVTFYNFESEQVVEGKIDYYKKNQEKGKRIILVDKKEAFWEKRSLDNISGSVITVEVPNQGRVYKLVMISFSKDCRQQFEKILESTSINFSPVK